MSEGRTSAAQADVEGEDRPTDGPATTGADDVTGSVGTNGHKTTMSDGDAHESGGDTHEGEPTDASTTSAATSGPTEDEATTETVPAATLPGDEPETPADTTTAAHDTTTAHDTTAHDATTESAGDDEWAEAEDKAYKKELRKGFAFGAAGGVLIGAIIALLLGALVWPGYLLGPGDPQDTANQVTQALTIKDSGTLDALSCRGPDGTPVSQLSPQVLGYITRVAPAGPTTTLIDTEARTPVDLTLSVQGQTQTLPSELVLGETKGDWCLKGLAQRQQ